MTKYFFLAIMLLLLQACKLTHIPEKLSKKELATAFIYQDGKEFEVKEDFTHLTLKREQFSLRFYNKVYKFEKGDYYAAMLSAFFKKEDIDWIQNGTAISDISCFFEGTTLAKGDHYRWLRFDHYAHHYLSYKNSDSKRLKILSHHRDYLKLEYQIESLSYKDVDEKVSDTKLNEFYILLFIDRNLNDIVDEGELKKIAIKLAFYN